MILLVAARCPVAGTEISELLKRIATRLLRALQVQKLRSFRSLTAFTYVPPLMEEIRRQTGRAHYRDMGILLTAVYGRRIDKTSLKTMMERHRANRMRR